MGLHLLLAGWGLGKESLWLDEVMSVEMATGSWEAMRAWFVMLPEQHPLYYVLVRPWLAVFGTSDVALRSFSLLLGVAAVGAMYLLGRRAMGQAEGLVGAALLAVSPFWIYYSQEGRMYTLLVLLAIVSSILWLDRERRVAEGGRPSRIPYWVVSVLGMYTHVFFAFVVMGHALATLLRDRAWGRNAVEGLLYGVPVLVGYLPWLILILTHMPEGQDWKGLRHVVFGIPYTLVRFALGYGELLANYQWQDRIGALLRENVVVLALAVATHAALFLRGAVDVVRLPRLRRVFMVSGLGLPLLLPLLASPVVILSGERYFMVVLPLYLLVLSAGLLGFVRSRSRAVAVLVVGGFALLSVRTVYAHHFEPDFGKEQWEEVVAAMEGSEEGTPVVVTPVQSTNTLRYHLPGESPLEVVAWDGEELTPSPTGELWIVVGRLEDPQAPVAALPPGWAVADQRLYPKETGLWLIRAVRESQGG